MRRAVTYVPDGDYFALRRWDGTTANRTRADIMDAPMSDDTRRVMGELLDRAAASPGTTVEYPEG
jgi:hypothetical protein